LLLVTLLAASGWLFSKAVLRDLPPLLFMAIRFGLSAMVLAGLVRRRVGSAGNPACGGRPCVAACCWGWP